MKLAGIFVLLFVLSSCGGSSESSLVSDSGSSSSSTSSSSSSTSGANISNSSSSSSSSSSGSIPPGSGSSSSSSGSPYPVSHELAKVTLGNSITLDASNSERTVGVTFTFSEDVQIGQFVDGSYFVVPAAGNSSLTIESLNAVGGKAFADENPNYLSHGLTDNTKNYGSYSAEEVLAFPYSVSGNTTIVAAVQKDEASYGNCGTKAIVGECIDALFSLTVLDSVPPMKAIRPSLSKKEKTILTLDDFDLTEIPHIPFFDGPSDESSIDGMRERWIQQTEIFSVATMEGRIFSEGGRAWRSDIYGGNYGSSTARSITIAWTWVMAANLNDPDTYEKYEGLIASLLVYGQDLYYAIFSGSDAIAGWGSGAGQSHGKIIPVSLYATLKRSNAEEFSNLSQLVRKVGGNKLQVPSELEQINAGKNGPVWGDGPDPQRMSVYDVGGYWGSVLSHQCFDGATGTCNTNSGKKTRRDPHAYIDGPGTAGSAYFSVSFGPNQAFAAIMILFPEVREMINAGATGDYADYKDAPIRFINRVVTQGLLTQPDRCAPPDPREDAENCDAYRRQNCLYYGLSNSGVATWGPDPADDDWSDGIDCIQNNSGGNTGQNGRFPSKHGSMISGGYTTRNISDNWNLIYLRYSE